MSRTRVSRDEAITVAQAWLRREHEPDYGAPLGVIGDSIEESEDAFGIPWQAQAFLDGDEKEEIIGTFPLIVDKRSGELMFGRALIALDIQLREDAPAGAHRRTHPPPVNSSACAKAVDARMTGERRAFAGSMTAGVPLKTIEREWGGPLDPKPWAEIQDELIQAGDGARGVMTLHAPGAAHIVNLVNDRGTIRINDGFIGKTATSLSDYLDVTGFQNPPAMVRFRLTYSDLQ